MHSPGPWHLNGNHPDQVFDRNGLSLAVAWSSGRPLPVEEWKANVALIAAAPDLLEALEWIADNCKEWEIERAAIRAIAKAKGETQ